MYVFWKNGTNSFKLDVNQITKPWSASSASWTVASTGDNWKSQGGDFGLKYSSLTAPGGSTVNIWDVFDMTNAVKEMVKDSVHNYGVLIQSISGSDGHGYRTSEYPEQNLRPKLTIFYDASMSIRVPFANKSGLQMHVVGNEVRIKRAGMMGVMQLEIFNYTGKLVAKLAVPQSGHVSLGKIKHGSYLARLCVNEKPIKTDRIHFR